CLARDHANKRNRDAFAVRCAAHFVALHRRQDLGGLALQVAGQFQRSQQRVGGQRDRDDLAVGLAVGAAHQAARRLQELRRLGQHLRRQRAQVVAGLPVLLAHVAPPRVPALAVLRGQVIVPGLRSLVPRRRPRNGLAVAVLRPVPTPPAARRFGRVWAVLYLALFCPIAPVRFVQRARRRLGQVVGVELLPAGRRVPRLALPQRTVRHTLGLLDQARGQAH